MKFLTFLSLFVFIAAHAAKPKPPIGFVALFNGKNLDGWWGLKTEDPAKWMALAPEQLAAKKKASLENIKKHWSVEDGAIVAAAQEERFTRVKHDSDFPEQAIRYCLAEAGDSAVSIDAVAFYDKPILKFHRILETYFSVAPRGVRPPPERRLQ